MFANRPTAGGHADRPAVAAVFIHPQQFLAPVEFHPRDRAVRVAYAIRHKRELARPRDRAGRSGETGQEGNGVGRRVGDADRQEDRALVFRIAAEEVVGEVIRVRSFRQAVVDRASADSLRHVPVGRRELEECVGRVGVVHRRHLPIGAVEVDCYIVPWLAGEPRPIPHLVALDDADRCNRVLPERIVADRDSSGVVVANCGRHVGDRQRGGIHRIVDRVGNCVGNPAAVGPLVDVVVHGSHGNRLRCRVVERQNERGGECQAAVGADLGLGIGRHGDLNGAGWHRRQRDLVGAGRAAFG